MKRMPRVWKVGAVGLLTLATLAGCLVGGYGGDDGDVGVGYVGGIYEPSGYEYGGWGRGYRVGPPRDAARGSRGRAAPSIPHGPRGGIGPRGGGKAH